MTEEQAIFQHVINALVYSVPDEVHYAQGIDVITDNGTIVMDNGVRYQITVTRKDGDDVHAR